MIVKREKVLTQGLLSKERAFEIDLLRGIPIIVVVLYHICFTFSAFPSIFSNYYQVIKNYPFLDSLYSFVISILTNSFLHTYLVPFFGGLFLFVCGISTTFSHNNVKRAGLIGLASFIVSLVTGVATYVVGQNLFIFFGILHVMSLTIFLYVLLNYLCKKIFGKELSVISLFLITMVLSFVSLIVITGYFPPLHFFPTWPTKVIHTYPIDRLISEPWTYPLEVVGYVRGVEDSWGLLPYATFIFFGIAVGKLLYGKQKTTRIPKLKNFFLFRPFCFIGRHTLVIYLLHQPIFLLLFVSLFLILGFRL